jgi:hypothetical protein
MERKIMRNFTKHMATGIIMGAIFLGGIAALIVGCRAFNFNDTVYKNVTITEKYRVNKNNDSYWIVLGENPDNGDLEFKIEDNMLRGQFNATSVFNKLKIGKTYNLTVIGFRSGLLSEYPNIINYEEVKE